MPKIMINNQNFSGFAPNYDDIKSVMKHENILINGWFTVNQRNQTVYTSGLYTLDMWRFWNCSVAVNDGYITITPNSGSGSILQLFENASALDGKTLTASIMLNNGEIYNGTIVRTNGTEQTFYENDSFALLMETSNPLTIKVKSGSLNVKAVKLEYGNISTLINDEKPEYVVELFKCQRYFYPLDWITGDIWYNAGNAYSNLYINVPLHIPMRIEPTIYIENIHGYDSQGADVYYTGKTIWASGMTFNGYRFQVSMSRALGVGVTPRIKGYLSAEL